MDEILRIVSEVVRLLAGLTDLLEGATALVDQFTRFVVGGIVLRGVMVRVRRLRR